MRLALTFAIAAVAASCATAPRPPPSVVYVSPFDRCVAGCAPFRCLASVESETDGDRDTVCVCTSGEKLTLQHKASR